MCFTFRSVNLRIFIIFAKNYPRSVPRTKLTYHLLALAVVAVWGVTFVCTKVLIAAGMAPAAIFFCRFVLAYAGIWAYTLLTGQERRLWNGWKEEGIFLLLGVTGGSLYFLTENTALAYTQASNTAFLVSSAPLFTAILTFLYARIGKGRFADSLEKIRLGWPLVGGTVLALAGMALVVFDGSRVTFSAKGDLLAIAAALCWAVYSLFMGQMTHEYGTLTATRKVFFYGLLTIIPFLSGHGASFSPAVLGQFPVWGISCSSGSWPRSYASWPGILSSTNSAISHPPITSISTLYSRSSRPPSSWGSG